MQNMSAPFFNMGQGYLQGSAAPISGEDVSNYYNPMAASVTANLKDIFGRQMSQATGQATQAAGGVGADRIGVAQAELAKQQGLSAGQTYANLWQQALQAAQQQKQMMAGAGYGIAQMGPAALAASLQGTGALGAAGAQQQAQQQQELMAQYQNEIAKLQWPFQTPQYLAGVTGSLGPAMGGTSQGTTTQPSPSPLSQILGIGTGIAGLAMGMPWLGAAGGAMAGMGGGKGSSVPASNMGYTGMQYPGMPGYSMGTYGGVSYPMLKSGGRIKYANGGSSYGKLIDTANMARLSHVLPSAQSGNPMSQEVLESIGGSFQHSDDADDSDQGFAFGGSPYAEVLPPMSHTYPRMPFPLGRVSEGGAVLPFYAGQGFADGGGEDSDVEFPRFEEAVSQLPPMISPIQGESAGSALSGSLDALRSRPIPFAPTAPEPQPDVTQQPLAASPRGMMPVGVGQSPLPTAGMNIPSVGGNRYAMPQSMAPYPDALQRDWGQRMARSPWLALAKAGARMAQTRGPIGSVIGAGIGEFADSLGGERAQLRGEEAINQKAQQLYQQAQEHLDLYSRGNFKVVGIGADGQPILMEQKSGQMMESPTQFAPLQGGTAIQRNASWLVANKIAPDINTAFQMIHSGVNQPAVYARAVEAAKRNLITAGFPFASTDDLERKARADVESRGLRPPTLTAPVAQPGSDQGNPIPYTSGVKRRKGQWYRLPDGTVKQSAVDD